MIKSNVKKLNTSYWAVESSCWEEDPIPSLEEGCQPSCGMLKGDGLANITTQGSCSGHLGLTGPFPPGQIHFHAAPSLGVATWFPSHHM